MLVRQSGYSLGVIRRSPERNNIIGTSWVAYDRSGDVSLGRQDRSKRGGKSYLKSVSLSFRSLRPVNRRAGTLNGRLDILLWKSYHVVDSSNF